MITLRKQIIEKYPYFFKDIDPNLKLFAREIRKSLREEGHEVLAVTGYPGLGKSNDAAIIGMLIDENYNFENNICYIPTSKEIEERYLKLPKYSYFHIDEATRGLHKQQWFDKIQQKLRELYDTEREGHFLCTALIMPRFQNFTENFRNFMIKYWINIPVKGLAVFYKRDEDKDADDPWHIKESYKTKIKKFMGKRIFERSLHEKIAAEQATDCYWFYAKIPKIPDDIWADYQKLKRDSRTEKEEDAPQFETYRDKINREQKLRWKKIIELRNKGFNKFQVAAQMGVSEAAIQRSIQQMRAWLEVQKSKQQEPKPDSENYFNSQKVVKTLEVKA